VSRPAPPRRGASPWRCGRSYARSLRQRVST
jgi:hypothetical protein